MKLYIIGLIVLGLLLIMIVYHLFLKKKKTKKHPAQNLIMVLKKSTPSNSPKIERYKDITASAKPELKNLVTLVNNMMGDKAPKNYCYDIDKIGIIDATSDWNDKTTGYRKMNRVIQSLVIPAVKDAIDRKNVYDMAALFLQMDRVTSGGDPTMIFSFVETDTEGNPTKIKLPQIKTSNGLKDTLSGVVSDPLFTNLTNPYAKQLMQELKASPNYDSNVITLEELGKMASLFVLLTSDAPPFDFTGYAPCDIDGSPTGMPIPTTGMPNPSPTR